MMSCAQIKEQIEGYLKDLGGRGRSVDTLKHYRRSLSLLLNYLGPDGVLTQETLTDWVCAMQNSGKTSPASINTRISAVNGLLNYIGHKEWSMAPLPVQKTECHRLSRKEYLRLLQAAKAQGKERAYFLIKLFACTAVQAGDMSRITVEAVRRGSGWWYVGGRPQTVLIPPLLQTELLGYAHRQGIENGCIFVGTDGKPLSRNRVWDEVQSLSSAAQISSEKANPRALNRLHQETYESISGAFTWYIQKAHNDLLVEENQLAGWPGTEIEHERGCLALPETGSPIQQRR